MTSTLGRSTRHSPSEDDHLDPERFRILVGAATRVPAVTLAVAATIVVTTMVLASSDLTGIYAAIAGTWLALHQVTLTIDGTSLGVLPLLPTAVLVWAAARAAAAAADAVVGHTGYQLEAQDVARITAAILAGPLTVTVVALVVMQDAAGVLPVASPNPAAALAWVTGMYLIATLLGIGSRMWRPLTRRYGTPEWLVLSAKPAARVVLGMFAVGGVLVVGGLVWSWTVVGELLERGQSWTGVLGLTILSILYLPNMIVGASAVLAGSTVQFGELRLSLFEATGGDLPALPVLAAIPVGPAGSLWPVLLAVPATVGALLGRFAAQRTLQAQADGSPVGSLDAALTVLCAAAGAGLATALLTWVSGGPLGIFGVVGANWWLAGVLVFAWAGLLGLITAQLLMWREGRLAASLLEEQRRSAAAEEAAEAAEAAEDGDAASDDDAAEDEDAADEDAADAEGEDTGDGVPAPDEQKALEAGAADEVEEIGAEKPDETELPSDNGADSEPDLDSSDPDSGIIDAEVVEVVEHDTAETGDSDTDDTETGGSRADGEVEEKRGKSAD